MKITVYTIKDCAFSKQEKEYLTTNNLAFEEKDLETNKDFLTEMLAVSNNFAGTPVTRVEKDDGTLAVLKGFTKEEFDTTLGLTPTTNPDVQTPNLGVSTNEQTVPPSVESVSPAPIPTPPTETPATQTPDAGLENPTPTDPLKSVMDNLQTQAGVTPQPPAVETPVVPPPVSPITDTPITDSSPAVPPPGAPTIPDFPAK